MVEAAQRNGVTFRFGGQSRYYLSSISKSVGWLMNRLYTNVIGWWWQLAWVPSILFQFLKKGLPIAESNPTNSLPCPSLRPVLGQALHLRLGHALGYSDFQPVITGNDVHIVPVVGKIVDWCTVEFPTNREEVVAARKAGGGEAAGNRILLCLEATVVRTWSGLRRLKVPAPIIGHLQGFNNVLLATGHYRNGVLLAPATAQAIRQIIVPDEF